MDEKKSDAVVKKLAPIEKVDRQPALNMTPHASINEFMVRLEALRSKRRDWADPKNQNRPFKPHFLNFIQDLVYRLPYVPEIVPQLDGTALLKYRKRSPRDKWQIMEITVTPQRRFSMVVHSRLPKQPDFTRNNLARPDILTDSLKAFYEHDAVNIEEHQIHYRPITTLDYGIIAGMASMALGPSQQYAPKNIASLLECGVVAYDPMYNVIAVAALGKAPDSGELTSLHYEVSLILTLQPFRGLGIGGKCLRQAIAMVLAKHPDARITANAQLTDGEARDNCRGVLARAGFVRTKVVRGECRYDRFLCDRCNLDRHLCEFREAASCCSTVFYELNDKGGRQGYGGAKKRH